MALQAQKVASGKRSALKGAAHCVGLTIKPEQILELLHDTQPNSPIPFDAILCAIGVKDEGSNSRIEFYFNSIAAPMATNCTLDPHHLLQILVNLGEGLLPRDSVLRGIELSDRFNLMLLIVESDKFPSGKAQLPLAHIRYVAGELILYHPSESLKGEKRIRISNSR
jgi:hypothetical protein